MWPTLRQLEYFVAVHDCGSFHAAARACAVTQPGLSGQLQQLESMLDVCLFERNRRQIRITAEGEVLLARARSVLNETRELVDAADALKGPLGGRLRLGVIPTIAPYLLPRVLPRIQATYPDLRIELREAQTEDLRLRLANGEVDLLIVALESELGNVETEPLFEDRFLAMLPKSHRLAKRRSIGEVELEGEPVLLLDDGHCLRDQVWSVCSSGGAEAVGDFRGSSLATLCQMVLTGGGMTLLPELALDVEARSAESVLIPFRKPRPYRTVGLAWRPTSPRGAEYVALGKLMRQGRQ